MRLRALAKAIFLSSLVLAVLVGLSGLLIWQSVKTSRADVDTLLSARERASRVDVAIRYLNHVRLEPEILRGLARDSGHLMAFMKDEAHPAARTARLHLEEIELLADLMISQLGGDPGDGLVASRLQPLAHQMRIHESGALDALNAIIQERNRSIVGVLQQSVGLLIFIALFIAALGCLALWIFFGRIQRPLRRFAEGVKQFGEGDGSVRIDIEGNDELAEMAALFNRAMQQRESLQIQLHERVKEQRCLYLVLQLTTDDHLSVAEVCSKVAEAVPPHLQYPDAAAARVRLGGDEHVSAGWRQPTAAIVAPIRVADRVVGEVEIAYLESRPDQAGGEGPFMREERDLLESIALHLARMLRHRETAGNLAQTQRMQAVGELTGGLAHDFNNLLTVIQGNAELLDQSLRRRDPELAEMASMIDAAACRGAELTQRLLAFARRQPLQPAAMEVNALLEGMQGLLRQTLGEHLDLKLKLDPSAWPALIDPAQLETAVLNLAINARDAMPQGGSLTIETSNVQLDEAYADSRTEVVPGAYLMIAVSDSGCGISPYDLQRIFEPFFTTKPKGGGTGLGLSMVYGFVKQSNGHVAAYSEMGEGTTIRMYLPRATNHELVSPDEPAVREVERGEARVLVVEDDDLVRRYTCDQLAALGYRVSSAASGSEALEALENDGPVDILLTDVVMPGGMSGKDLADAACARYEGLQVVFMSGYTENAIVHHGRLDPGVRLLSKPFRRQELARKMHEVLADIEGGGGNDGAQ